MGKINLPLDKRRWPLGLIPGQIVLISTSDHNGEPNVAPISWIQMVSFEPSLLMFSGGRDGATVRNIIDTESFGANLVNSSMADAVFECIKWHGKERIERAGFRLERADKIAAPLVIDCPAQIECELYDTREMGGAVIVFGEIVRVVVDEHIMMADRDDRYRILDPVMFLEDGLWAGLGEIGDTKGN